MADTQEPVVAPVSAPQAVEAPASVETPVAPQPLAASTTEAATSPAETKVEANVDAPAETVKTEAPVESVLGDEKPATEKKDTAPAKVEKPAETKAETPAEIKPEVKELPAYEAFKVPEGLQLDKEPLDAFTKILGEIETGKLDHLGMQEKGQALIDLAAKSTAESINRLNDYYVQFHENQKKEWFNSLKADPEMGGDKFEENVGVLREAVEQYGGTQEQIKEFRALMKETGVGNHPALNRILYNMQQKINKYTTEGSENRIVPGARPAPSKVKPYQQFYQG